MLTWTIHPKAVKIHTTHANVCKGIFTKRLQRFGSVCTKQALAVLRSPPAAVPHRAGTGSCASWQSEVHHYSSWQLNRPFASRFWAKQDFLMRLLPPSTQPARSLGWGNFLKPTPVPFLPQSEKEKRSHLPQSRYVCKLLLCFDGNMFFGIWWFAFWILKNLTRHLL